MAAEESLLRAKSRQPFMETIPETEGEDGALSAGANEAGLHSNEHSSPPPVSRSFSAHEMGTIRQLAMQLYQVSARRQNQELWALFLTPRSGAGWYVMQLVSQVTKSIAQSAVEQLIGSSQQEQGSHRSPVYVGDGNRRTR